MKKMPYTIPANKQIRLIINTDCCCEADDQFALVHALLPPKFDVVGVLSAHYVEPEEYDSEELSYQEIKRVLSLMEMEQIPVYRGSNCALKDFQKSCRTEAAEFIVQEAMKEDSRPLFIACQSALTNVAAACLMCPEIAERITLVWIGGAAYPEGGPEFNLMNDRNAANILLEFQMPVWQIPQNVYSRMIVPFSVLYKNVRPCGRLGEYLFEKMLSVNERFSELLAFPGMTPPEVAVAYPGGEMWSLGDSPAVGVLLYDEPYYYHEQEAPYILPDGRYETGRYTHKIRVYDNIDRDFIMEDFYAKIQFCFGD